MQSFFLIIKNTVHAFLLEMQIAPEENAESGSASEPHTTKEATTVYNLICIFTDFFF